ncbi:type IV secretion system protein VirB9 [Gemmobacter caeni]|uniref:Type IV secretion system protein VirB9 n=2 Tax=Gemmobacter caeni TaxID=589035 RepID=A0A2T6ADD0_9RHOB|nr:type IV secretion system protein VirB9 [Gemmobacter caeni]TWI90620.1 type IV secretion system protein VirB9 [Gemmobacter caeni]
MSNVPSPTHPHRARHTTLAAAAFTALVLFPGTLMAEVAPSPGSRDVRVTYATYHEGQVYRIRTQLKTVTLVELGDGERIQSVAIGDLESFKVDKLERPNLFILKPVVAGAATNVTVETNRHIYFLYVQEVSRGEPMYSVKFTVPGARTAAVASDIPPGTPLTYRFLKRRDLPDFAPLSIVDDGRKVTFTIPPDAPMPTVFGADERGRETSINARVEGTRITVTSRSARYVLRYGDAYLCIEGE